MALVWPILLTQAALVAVQPRGGDECPTSRQVADALSTRMPGVLVPPDTQRPEVLLLVFSATGTAMTTFSLLDQDGRPRLERSLASVMGAKPGDCVALADTVALIVERFLQELEVRARPVPAPPRRPMPAAPSGTPPERAWDLSVGSSWRPGEPGLAAAHLRVLAGRVLGLADRLKLVVSAGVSGRGSYVTDGVTAELRRFPVSAGLLLRLLLGPGELELGPTVGLDIVTAEARAGTMVKPWLRPGPEAGLVVGFRLPLSPSWFLRFDGGLTLAIVRYEFLGGQGAVAFSTPRAYAHFGGALGFSF